VKPLSIALLLVSVTATAADKQDRPDDFKTIVKRVEQHYGKAHMKVPMMGLVSFASHFTRPIGASDFKLAIIEGIGVRDEALPEFNPGPEWRAVIRTTSRHGDHMVMFGRDEGGHAIRTLLVTVDNDEAVVMEMRLDPTHFAKMLSDRSQIDKPLGDRGKSHFEY
jgi:hypothetical protein